MSETAEEKTRRGFLSAYKRHYYPMQTSIYLQDYNQRLDALRYYAEIRKRLPRLYPEVGILWRIVLSEVPYYARQYVQNLPKDTKAILPILVLFTFNGLPYAELEDSIKQHLAIKFRGEIVPLFVSQRLVSGWKRSNYIKTITREPPHDLKGYFGLKNSPQRFGILNSKHRVGIAERLNDQSDL